MFIGYYETITGGDRIVGPFILKSVAGYPEMAWTFANRGVYRPPYAPTSAQNVRNRKYRKILDWKKKSGRKYIFFLEKNDFEILTFLIY